jgi:diguanylate cyclase (GGDEF)-like protein
MDMEHRLKPVRALSMGILAIALLMSGHWMGFWPLAPLAFAMVGFVAVDHKLESFSKPEWALAGVWMAAQVVIATSVVLTGGLDSPALTWLAIPVVTLAARFDMRGVVAGVLFTATLMIIVTLGLSTSEVLAAPQYMIAPLALLLATSILSTALMSSDLDHRQDSVIDGLTGMLNRRSLDARVQELSEQAAVTGEPIGLIIGDLDRFKSVNDTHGHAVGDAVLVDVAYSIRKELRAFDLAYRLGGEEFLVVLPGATAAEAQAVAERLRAAVETNPAGGLPVTMSFGVASSGGGAFDYETTFGVADAALYRAKQTGRNRVECGGPVPALSLSAAAA